MRTYRGFVCAVHQSDGTITLFGADDSAARHGLSYTRLGSRPLLLFATKGKAHLAARSLKARPGGSDIARIAVGYVEIRIGFLPYDCNALSEKDNLFALTIGRSSEAKGEVFFFGPGSCDEGGFNGRMDAQRNGWRPFPNYADAERAANEMTRQAGGTVDAAVAQIIFDWQS